LEAFKWHMDKEV